MTDLDQVTALVDDAARTDGDRYDKLVAAHDALRAALADTDGDTQAAGR